MQEREKRDCEIGLVAPKKRVSTIVWSDLTCWPLSFEVSAIRESFSPVRRVPLERSYTAVTAAAAAAAETQQVEVRAKCRRPNEWHEVS